VDEKKGARNRAPFFMILGCIAPEGAPDSSSRPVHRAGFGCLANCVTPAPLLSYPLASASNGRVEWVLLDWRQRLRPLKFNTRYM
jgi:hypothetical protein